MTFSIIVFLDLSAAFDSAHYSVFIFSFHLVSAHISSMDFSVLILESLLFLFNTFFFCGLIKPPGSNYHLHVDDSPVTYVSHSALPNSWKALFGSFIRFKLINWILSFLPKYFSEWLLILHLQKPESKSYNSNSLISLDFVSCALCPSHCHSLGSPHFFTR